MVLTMVKAANAFLKQRLPRCRTMLELGRYWKKQTSLEELLAVNNETQRLAWTLQADTGMHPCL